MKPLKRVVIKEELVELTGDYRPALILNQFIYWSERMYDTDNFIREEKERAIRHQMEISIEESKGWIYKTAEELNEELMVGMSLPTIRKYIKQLIEKGYVLERRNPKYKWDKTMQYRIDLYKIQKDLAKLGYALEGYKLLPNIQVYEGLEEEIYTDNLEEVIENKKSPTYTEAEDTQKSKKSNFDNSIPQNKENETLNLEIDTKNLENDRIDTKKIEDNKVDDKKIDFEQLAYEKCLNEIEGFEAMDSMRKDFFFGMMLKRVSVGE